MKELEELKEEDLSSKVDKIEMDVKFKLMKGFKVQIL